MTAIIDVRQLHKKYKNATEEAVKGISFQIEAGEIFSLLGPNGAGKTTTLSMLACLLEPTAGEAFIDGHSIRNAALQVKRSLGVVPQDIALYPTLSARENLAFWGRMYGLQGHELKDRIGKVLERVGLADRADDRIETYSGGMKRRINIAVGLLHQPKVLFMDEPTVGIDPQSRRRILDMVKEFNQAGMTVLYTTHYMEEAQELSDRIGIIDHGEMIAAGTLDELTRLVGESDVVDLITDRESTVAEFVQALRDLPEIQQVKPENGSLRLLVTDGNACLPEIIATAIAQQVRILNVSIQEPNLEAVFLHLTGRGLRDG